MTKSKEGAGDAAIEAAVTAYCGHEGASEEDAMRAAIRAYLAALPWRYVPRHMTDAMRERSDLTDAEWRCALQAAPAPPGLEES